MQFQTLRTHWQDPVRRAGWLYNVGNVMLIGRAFWQGDNSAFDPLPLLACTIFFIGNAAFSRGKFRWGCALSALGGTVLALVMFQAGAYVAALFTLCGLVGGMTIGALITRPWAARVPGLGGLISRLPSAGDTFLRGDAFAVALFLLWFAADLSLMQKRKDLAA